jgi:hypothetical protein
MAKKPLPTEVPTNDEAWKMAPEGLKWLYEMEAVNSTALQNNLYGNLYSFPGVSDCEILMDRYQRKMLIYIKFTFFIRKFLKRRKKELIMAMLDQLQELLPSFEFRIIEDRALFDLALKRMEEMLFGGKVAQKPSEPIKAATGDVSASGHSPVGPSPVPGIVVATTGMPASPTISSPAESPAIPPETDPKKPSGT